MQGAFLFHLSHTERLFKTCCKYGHGTSRHIIWYQLQSKLKDDLAYPFSDCVSKNAEYIAIVYPENLVHQQQNNWHIQKQNQLLSTEIMRNSFPQLDLDALWWFAFDLYEESLKKICLHSSRKQKTEHDQTIFFERQRMVLNSPHTKNVLAQPTGRSGSLTYSLEDAASFKNAWTITLPENANVVSQNRTNKEEGLGVLTLYGKSGLGFGSNHNKSNFQRISTSSNRLYVRAKLPMYSSGVMTSTFMMGSSNDMWQTREVVWMHWKGPESRNLYLSDRSGTSHITSYTFLICFPSGGHGSGKFI